MQQYLNGTKRKNSLYPVKISFKNICEIKTLRPIIVTKTSHWQLYTIKKNGKVLTFRKERMRRERNGNDVK